MVSAFHTSTDSKSEQKQSVGVHVRPLAHVFGGATHNLVYNGKLIYILLFGKSPGNIKILSEGFEFGETQRWKCLDSCSS